MRMANRRFTRVTNAFYMVAPYSVLYNFIRMHKTLRVLPEMTSGLAENLWSMDDLVGLMDEVAPKPGRAVHTRSWRNNDSRKSEGGVLTEDPPSDLVHGRGGFHNLSAAHERTLIPRVLRCNYQTDRPAKSSRW